MLRRKRVAPGATMGPMNPVTGPIRFNAQVQRLARVKFVALPLEAAPPSEPDLSLPARLLASLRNSLIRVIGCLEAARP
jgi:hypothetical protein